MWFQKDYKQELADLEPGQYSRLLARQPDSQSREAKLAKKADALWHLAEDLPVAEPRPDTLQHIRARLSVQKKIAPHYRVGRDFRSILFSPWTYGPAAAFVFLLILYWPQLGPHRNPAFAIRADQPALVRQQENNRHKTWIVPVEATANISLSFFHGKSRLVLTPGSAVTTRENIRREGDAGELSFAVLRGEVLYQGLKIRPDQRLSFHSGNFEFQVRGTEFSLKAATQNTGPQITLTDGKVAVRPNEGADNTSDTPGTQLVLEPGQALELPARLPEKSSARFNEKTLQQLKKSIRPVSTTEQNRLRNHFAKTESNARPEADKTSLQTGSLKATNQVTANAKNISPKPKANPSLKTVAQPPKKAVNPLAAAHQKLGLKPGQKIQLETTAGSRVQGEILTISADTVKLKTNFGEYKVNGSAVRKIGLSE